MIGLLLLTLALDSAVSSALAMFARQKAQSAVELANEADRERGSAEKERETVKQQAVVLETAKDVAERSVYYGNLYRAQRNWVSGQAGLMRQRLGEYKTEYIDATGEEPPWEWRYFWRLCNQDNAIAANASGINQLALNSDDSLPAIVNQNKQVLLIDTKTRKVKQTLTHPMGLGAVAFHPSRDVVATGDYAGVIRLWNIASAEAKVVEGHQGSVNSVQFTPDGKFLVSSGKDQVAKVWKTDNFKEIETFSGFADERTQWPFVIALSKTGTKLAVGGEFVKVYSVGDFKELLTIKQDDYRVRSMSMHTNDEWLAINGDKTAAIYSPITGKEISSVKAEHSDRIRFSVDNNVLVCRQFKAKKGGKPYEGLLIAHLDKTGVPTNTLQIAVNSRGDRIATGGWDGLTKIWDANSAKLLRASDWNSWFIFGVVFSPNGDQVITAGHNPRAEM